MSNESRTGEYVGMWSLAFRGVEGAPRPDGAVGIECNAVPYIPGAPFPRGPYYEPVATHPELRLFQAMTPLVAHLAATAMHGYINGRAQGERVLATERAAIHALLDEALDCAGPVARRIVAERRERIWTQLTDAQRAVLRAARDAGAAGLASEAHPAAFTEVPSLLDRGYLAEVSTGMLVLTLAGAAIVPGSAPTTEEIEHAG